MDAQPPAVLGDGVEDDAASAGVCFRRMWSEVLERDAPSTACGGTPAATVGRGHQPQRAGVHTMQERFRTVPEVLLHQGRGIKKDWIYRKTPRPPRFREMIIDKKTSQPVLLPVVCLNFEDSLGLLASWQ